MNHRNILRRWSRIFFIASLGLLPLAAAVVALAIELLHDEPEE